ncbi:hypothetical protein Tco_0474851 [Tanacetum coccineum]
MLHISYFNHDHLYDDVPLIHDKKTKPSSALVKAGELSYLRFRENSLVIPFYPKVDLKGITTRSGVAYQGTTIPKVVERETEPAVAPVSAPMPNLKTSISYPSRCNDEKLREKANDQIEKFYKIFQDMSFEISLADALILMSKFASTLKALIKNKEKLGEMAGTPLNEHCSAVILNKLLKKLGDPSKFLILCDFPEMDECLALADLGASINLMPLSVWKNLSLPKLTPTCMTLELADRSSRFHRGYREWQYQSLLDPIVSTFFYDSPLPSGIVHFILRKLMLAQLLKMIQLSLEVNDKSSIDEPPEVELKDLPPHLEYVFLEGDNKLPVIIVKDLSVEEKAALIKVLKSHKRAITWKLSDIKGTDNANITRKRSKPDKHGHEKGKRIQELGECYQRDPMIERMKGQDQRD